MKKGVVRKVIQSNLQSMDAKDRRWLTGYIEAEGSFTESKRGDLQFVITQGYRNLAVLHHIKKIIGFGSINKQGPRTFRYVVQDQIGLAEIISFLNGNLVLKKRIAGLAKFIEAYNARYTTSIEAITTGVEPTREDG